MSDITRKIKKIAVQKKEASVKYQRAKEIFANIVTDIKRTGGEFDIQPIQKAVTDMFNFISQNDSAFTYLTKDISSYEDYLCNRSVNTCAIATAILNQYNARLAEIVNNYLANFLSATSGKENDSLADSFINYLPEEILDMSTGFMLHDIGNVLIPAELLKKRGKLTNTEFAIVKTHSYEKGVDILEKNGINNPFILNPVRYHHCALFVDESNCYPEKKMPSELPAYVKICKLADIYDAMTSKRSYHEALNPIGVVKDIFLKYSQKDVSLQFILHSFLKIVGTYPAGSVLSLQNGQMCYVLISDGPVVLPLTDSHGAPLTAKPEPIDLADERLDETTLRIDPQKPLKSPTEVYDSLPTYLKETILN
jgi:HD-GYP domain-containing protein (c-di-GMP phosphodiesterase class II)